jgi:hypothetical protein
VKYTPKNQVKVEGKMTPKDAGIVGKRLATAAVIAAVGIAVGSGGAGLGLLLKLFVK